MKRGSYSFKQWCIDNDRQWLIDMWCYDLNGCSPEDVPFKSNKRYYFHCGNRNHEPEYRSLSNFVKGNSKVTKENFCTGCNSFGEFVNNNYPDIGIEKIWSDKNDVWPYSIRYGTHDKVWLKCLSNPLHSDYEICSYDVISRGISCPYCTGRRLCYTNSLGFMFPEVIPLWSEKNDKTPFDYTPWSHKIVYCKCENGLHDDFKRKVEDHTNYHFKCPICAKLNKQMPRGEDHPNWNPDTPENVRVRNSSEYALWRRLVFEKDDYTCQCCGSNIDLQAHHMKAFIKYKDLRLDVDNGMTLCKCCHENGVKGSLHNTYGTKDVSPETLEKYINETRQKIGIDIPFSLEEYHNGINILTHNNEVNTA